MPNTRPPPSPLRSAPSPMRPADETVAVQLEALLKENPMSVVATWIASELRRARHQESELARRLESLGL
ncbi:MAG TPA: hypothetical protein VFN91_13290 [Myxococcaceae bacterium]|nr:hypothetical protein [Myxococcaceae bacterium]